MRFLATIGYVYILTLTVGSLLIILACAITPAWAADQSVSGALVDVLHTKGVIDDATYTDLKNTGTTGGEQAVNKKLIEVLHNKGVIDDAAYGKLNEEAAKQAAAPAPAPAAPQASPAPAAPVAASPSERPLDKAFSSVEEGFARLGGDTVKLKIGTWTELGWLNDTIGSSTYFPGLSNALTKTAGNNFHVRYARLYFNFTVADKLGFRIAFDAAPTSSNILRDAFVWADYIPYTRITLGRFLTPYGDEVWRAPFDVPTINYAMASTFIQIPTSRSTGLMLSGKYSTKVAGLPLGAGYAAALINGLENTTFTDNNDQKDFLGRAWINPFVDGLSMGGSWYVGKSHFDPATIGGNKVPELNPDYDRWAAEFDFQPTRFAKGLFIRGEYLWQRRYFQGAAGDSAVVALDPSVDLAPSKNPVAVTPKFYHSQGWYVTAAYRFNGLTGIAKYLNDLEPLARFEQFDEDTATPNDSRHKTTIGLNYYLAKYARLMLNYEIVHADSALRTFTLQTADNNFKNHEVFTTHLQIWF